MLNKGTLGAKIERLRGLSGEVYTKILRRGKRPSGEGRRIKGEERTILMRHQL